MATLKLAADWNRLLSLYEIQQRLPKPYVSAEKDGTVLSNQRCVHRS